MLGQQVLDDELKTVARKSSRENLIPATGGYTVLWFALSATDVRPGSTDAPRGVRSLHRAARSRRGDARAGHESAWTARARRGHCAIAGTRPVDGRGTYDAAVDVQLSRGDGRR